MITQEETYQYRARTRFWGHLHSRKEFRLLQQLRWCQSIV